MEEESGESNEPAVSSWYRRQRERYSAEYDLDGVDFEFKRMYNSYVQMWRGYTLPFRFDLTQGG